MDTLWAQPGREVTAREVADALVDYAYTTITTVLDRLVRKGMVHRRLEGLVLRFEAIGTRGAHTAVLMHEALAIDGDPDAALVRFARTLTESQVAVLCRALNELNR